MTRTEFVVAESTDQMRSIVMHLTSLACWFEVDPQPDGTYFIEVKKEVGDIAFPFELHRFQHARRFE